MKRKSFLILLFLLITTNCIAADFLVLQQTATVINCHDKKPNTVCITIGNYRWEEQSTKKYTKGERLPVEMVFQPITTTANEDEEKQRVFRLIKILIR